IPPEPLDDKLTQLATELELRRSRASRPTPRRPLGRVRAIAPTTAATVDLTRDRGVRAPEGATDTRADSPRAIPREISSRSARVRQRSDRRLALGRIPPTLSRYLLTVRFGMTAP